MKWYFILLIILGSLLLLILIIFLLQGIAFYKISFKRRKNDEIFDQLENPEDKKESSRIWFSKQRIDVFTIKSKDNLKLKGYFLNNNSNKIALILHGYHGRYYSSTTQAKIFYELGYDVLMPNNRAHDTSEGKYFTMGPKEINDVLLWIDLLIKRNPKYEIVLMGVSMGGHIAMMVAGNNNLPKNVKCVIEDCGYGSLRQILYDQISKKFSHHQSLVMLRSLSLIAKINNFSINDDTKNTLPNIKIPILLIHGNKDTYVSFNNLSYNEKLVNKDVYKEVVVFENANHNEAKKQLKKYQSVITNFVGKFIYDNKD